MRKEPFLTYSKIFLASIFVYTGFFFSNVAYGSNGLIQTTAEQTGGNRFLYLTDQATEVATQERDARIRWNGFASTTGSYMIVTDTEEELAINPNTDRFYILSWTSDSLGAQVKYKNQNGTERTLTYSNYYPVDVDGQTYYLFKMASTTAGDTTARNITWLINRRYFLFVTFTDERLENTITGEASTYAYMDQLNSEHLGEMYSVLDPLASEILEISQPESGTTTPTASVDFSFVYYNAYAGTQVNKWNLMLYDKVNARYLFYDYDLPAGEFGEASETVTLPSSMYEATISLYNSSVPELLRSPTKIDFNVLIDVESLFGIPSFDEMIGLATSTCSISNLAGCFQNALVLLFYPSENVLDKFSDLKEDMENKPPFGYVSLYTSQLADLSASGEGSFELEIEENIKEKIFDPLRSGLVKIIWVCFGFWFFNRLRKQEL